MEVLKCPISLMNRSLAQQFLICYTSLNFVLRPTIRGQYLSISSGKNPHSLNPISALKKSIIVKYPKVQPFVATIVFSQSNNDFLVGSSNVTLINSALLSEFSPINSFLGSTSMSMEFLYCYFLIKSSSTFAASLGVFPNISPLPHFLHKYLAMGIIPCTSMSPSLRWGRWQVVEYSSLMSILLGNSKQLSLQGTSRYSNKVLMMCPAPLTLQSLSSTSARLFNIQR